jgi:hypothetical protein
MDTSHAVMGAWLQMQSSENGSYGKSDVEEASIFDT